MDCLNVRYHHQYMSPSISYISLGINNETLVIVDGLVVGMRFGRWVPRRLLGVSVGLRDVGTLNLNP